MKDIRDGVIATVVGGLLLAAILDPPLLGRALWTITSGAWAVLASHVRVPVWALLVPVIVAVAIWAWRSAVRADPSGPSDVD